MRPLYPATGLELTNLAAEIAARDLAYHPAQRERDVLLEAAGYTPQRALLLDMEEHARRALGIAGLFAQRDAARDTIDRLHMLYNALPPAPIIPRQIAIELRIDVNIFIDG